MSQRSPYQDERGTSSSDIYERAVEMFKAGDNTQTVRKTLCQESRLSKAVIGNIVKRARGKVPVQSNSRRSQTRSPSIWD